MHLLMANQVLILFIKQLKNALWSVSAKDIPKDNATRSSSKTNNNKHRWYSLACSKGKAYRVLRSKMLYSPLYRDVLPVS